MKAKFTLVEFDKEYESHGRTMYAFRAVYIGPDLVEYEARFSSVKRDQDYFKVNQECEFTAEEKIDRDGRPYMYIRRPKQQGSSNYSRAKKVEQSRYSGFAMSYAKDLVVADKLKFDQMLDAAEKMFNFMVELDKRNES